MSHRTATLRRHLSILLSVVVVVALLGVLVKWLTLHKKRGQLYEGFEIVYQTSWHRYGNIKLRSHNY